MAIARFEKLAQELAERDPELPSTLRDVRQAVEVLREIAVDAVDAFRRRAHEIGAHHLTHLMVSPVTADEKHVDCVSFRVERGRLVLLCVGIAGTAPRIRMVGPYKRGKAEGPCSDQPLRGHVVEQALEDGLEQLIREASVA